MQRDNDWARVRGYGRRTMWVERNCTPTAATAAANLYCVAPVVFVYLLQ